MWEKDNYKHIDGLNENFEVEPRDNTNYERREYIRNNPIGIFEKPDKLLANDFIEFGGERYIADSLELFNELDSEITLKLISKGYIKEVADKIKHFKELDPEVSEHFISRGFSKVLLSNTEVFTGLEQSIAETLINSGNVRGFIENFDSFIITDLEKIVDRIIAVKQGYLLVYLLEKINEKDHNMIAVKMIEAGYARTVSKNINMFMNLDKNTLERIKTTN